jgi:hypothetical protein
VAVRKIIENNGKKGLVQRRLHVWFEVTREIVMNPLLGYD